MAIGRVNAPLGDYFKGDIVPFNKARFMLGEHFFIHNNKETGLDIPDEDVTIIDITPTKTNVNVLGYNSRGYREYVYVYIYDHNARLQHRSEKNINDIDDRGNITPLEIKVNPKNFNQIFYSGTQRDNKVIVKYDVSSKEYTIERYKLITFDNWLIGNNQKIYLFKFEESMAIMQILDTNLQVLDQYNYPYDNNGYNDVYFDSGYIHLSGLKIDVNNPKYPIPAHKFEIAETTTDRTGIVYSTGDKIIKTGKYGNWAIDKPLRGIIQKIADGSENVYFRSSHSLGDIMIVELSGEVGSMSGIFMYSSHGAYGTYHIEPSENCLYFRGPGHPLKKYELGTPEGYKLLD